MIYNRRHFPQSAEIKLLQIAKNTLPDMREHTDFAQLSEDELFEITTEDLGNMLRDAYALGRRDQRKGKSNKEWED